MHLYFWEKWISGASAVLSLLYILEMGLGIPIYWGWLLGCSESCPFYTDARFAGAMAESKRFDTKSTGCLEGLFNFLALNQRLQMPKMIAYQKHSEGSSKVLHISTFSFAFFGDAFYYFHRIVCAMLFPWLWIGSWPYCPWFIFAVFIWKLTIARAGHFIWSSKIVVCSPHFSICCRSESPKAQN